MSDPTSSARVLLVEDDPGVGRLLVALLKSEGFEADLVETGAAFTDALARVRPDICILDLNLPDASGLDLLQKMKEQNIAIPSVMLTGSDSVEAAVQAMKLGAVDFMNKPVEQQRLITTLKNALRLTASEATVARLQAEVEQAWAPEQIVGSSAAMDRLRKMIAKGASTDVTVLIQGETGTGKELVARALHYASARKQSPFVDVNCAALTESLIESELFGHEKGAFTGAINSRQGKFEAARGGSIFLDEIGDMPISTQAKMLRVLQERVVQRVGGNKSIQVDARVICATNQNLESMVGEKEFRQDLLYRINTLVVEVPPLRERREDIPELAKHFLARAARREKRPELDISPEAVSLLEGHSWPGNVRELEHSMDRAVILCDSTELQTTHFPTRYAQNAPEDTPLSINSTNLLRATEALERKMISDALEKAGWVKARAANALGITVRILSYKMVNLGIDKTD